MHYASLFSPFAKAGSPEGRNPTGRRNGGCASITDASLPSPFPKAGSAEGCNPTGRRNGGCASMHYASLPSPFPKAGSAEGCNPTGQAVWEDVPPCTTLLYFAPSRKRGVQRGAYPHWQAVWRMCLHRLIFFIFPLPSRKGARGMAPPPDCPRRKLLAMTACAGRAGGGRRKAWRWERRGGWTAPARARPHKQLGLVVPVLHWKQKSSNEIRPNVSLLSAKPTPQALRLRRGALFFAIAVLIFIGDPDHQKPDPSQSLARTVYPRGWLVSHHPRHQHRRRVRHIHRPVGLLAHHHRGGSLCHRGLLPVPPRRRARCSRPASGCSLAAQ